MSVYTTGGRGATHFVPKGVCLALMLVCCALTDDVCMSVMFLWHSFMYMHSMSYTCVYIYTYMHIYTYVYVHKDVCITCMYYILCIHASAILWHTISVLTHDIVQLTREFA